MENDASILNMPRIRNDPLIAQFIKAIRRVIDKLPVHIYVKDLRGRILIANAATGRALGATTPEELTTKSDLAIFPPEVAAELRSEEQQIVQSGQTLLSRPARTIDQEGRECWLLTSRVVLYDGDGRAIGIIGINHDITACRQADIDRQRAQGELARQREVELLRALADAQQAHEELRAAQLHLIHAEKMESVGRLAAGIAHEVKNPLAVVAMGIEYLTLCANASDEQTPLALERMRSAVARADAVIRGLLDFSAPHTLHAMPGDINAVITQSLMLVKHEIQRSHVKVVAELAAGLPALMLDAAKMEQVLVNLLLNAAQAMENGGTLVVRTHCRQVAATAGCEQVLVEVEDTGPGIPEADLHRVFDPFFTTKSPGKGTGLGLTVARTIVEMHGGTLKIRNRAEGGVRVTMTLNVVQPPQVHGGQGRAPVEPPPA